MAYCLQESTHFLKYILKFMRYISSFFSISPIQVIWSSNPVCSHFLNIFPVSPLHKPGSPKAWDCLALSQLWKVAHTMFPLWAPHNPFLYPITLARPYSDIIFYEVFPNSPDRRIFLPPLNLFWYFVYGIHITHYRQLWV